MSGDQLACQWRMIRVIEAGRNGLTVSGLAELECTGIRTIYRDLVRAFKGAVFCDRLESVFKEFRTSLLPKTLSFLKSIQFIYYFGIKPYKEHARFREILNQLNEAILNNRRIKLLVVMAEKFTPPREFDLDQLLSQYGDLVELGLPGAIISRRRELLK